MLVIGIICYIPNYIRLKKKAKKYGDYELGSEYFVVREESLKQEKNQIREMLETSFPRAEVGIYRAEDILEFMNQGNNYYEACHWVRKRISAEAEWERMEKEEEAKNAEIRRQNELINEMRKANENLEYLQRRQEYENYLREREYSRREYEDLKRRCNKKYGE